VYELLGGPLRDKIRFYTHVSRETPEELGEDAKRVVRRGWNAIKYLTTGPSKDQGVVVKNDLDKADKRIQMVREAVGDDIDIMLDCHGRYTPSDAIKVGLLVEPYKPFFYEEPVPP
jgi:L-alanine-DL-glutamate epimerase-like enolase superfamily enzyme